MNSGLEGVVAAETRLSMVDGDRGELVIAGFPVGELAANASFEETVWLLWNGDLPGAEELVRFRTALASQRPISQAAINLLGECARAKIDPMDALRIVAGTITLDAHGDEHLRLVAEFPTIVAAYWRLLQGRDIVQPDPSLGHAENYLSMLEGVRPSSEQTRVQEAPAADRRRGYRLVRRQHAAAFGGFF